MGRTILFLLLATLTLLLLPGGARSAPEPPARLTARDNPNDSGHGILLEWEAPAGAESILAYEVFRLPWRPESEGPPHAPDTPDSVWIQVGTVPQVEDQRSLEYVDEDDERMLGTAVNQHFVPRNGSVYYRVRSLATDGTRSAFCPIVSGTAIGNWFHTQRVNALVIAIILGALMVYFIRKSAGGIKLYIRPIPGLAHIDEAVGRATEMGRPILFVLGTGTAGDIATLAAYTILARVARITAEYQTPVLVPVNDPVMMLMAQGTVKEAYLEAGRPDLYRPENIFYISAMQFPYVAAVNGLMLREKCATNFYMGVFHAESLLLAEAGSTTGAIQISGTDQVSQIPFFVAATDFTLIGEELYAASAYLSQDPKLIGPLKAQDFVKAAILLIALLGVLEATLLSSQWVRSLIEAH
ncbi:MAG: hypothetical protein KAY32_05400 [Candidatus Eisenbacteria sp.]|nr:hypothetical protein [Candidatus Eisenbacteria bacterium]